MPSYLTKLAKEVTVPAFIGHYVPSTWHNAWFIVGAKQFTEGMKGIFNEDLHVCFLRKNFEDYNLLSVYLTPSPPPPWQNQQLLNW